MIESLCWFVGLSTIVLVCGIILARASDRLGKEFRLGGSMAGFLLLAGATSLPELVLSTEAARLGDADMAFGDLLGSCLFNLLILGLLDLFSRSRERMLSPRSAAHALTALVTILLASIVGIGILLENDLNLPGWWPLTLSVGSLLVMPAYFVATRMILLDMAISEHQVRLKANATRRWPTIAVYMAAAACLLVVGPKLASVAIEFADQSGLGGTFVGTTFVAAVTSLPEVVTTYAALRLGAPDMAVGNVLGSNAFNLLMISVVDVLSPGRLFAEVSGVHVASALTVMLVTSVAAIGLVYRAERKFARIEPDAALVVLLSIAGFILVYALS